MKIAFKSLVSNPSLAIGGRPAGVVDQAILSKSATAIMALYSTDRCLDLEVEGDVELEQTNPFLVIGGLPAGGVDPETKVQRVGSVVYEGLRKILQGINECSDMFPPLKTATGVILKIIDSVEVCVLVYNNNN
jgi:hypothetical protein